MTKTNDVRLRETWDKLSHDPFHQAGFFPSERYLSDWIGSQKNKRVLEIGCGQGRIIVPLARQNNQVIGIDISNEMLSICQTRLKQEGLNVPLVRADTRHLPFRDGVFELVYSLGVVEHFEETAQAINEHARVSKVEGTVIVSVPHRRSFYHLFKIFSQFLHLFRFGFEQSFTKRELRQMTQAAQIRITNLIAQEIVPESTVTPLRHLAAYGVLLLDKLLLPVGLGGMTIIVRGKVMSHN
ncbi:MAG: class I SAM-dependent methyltransferase [Chloroflexi bacterium]|nr:class I SAM-dependent methyltransferase [Chloroflexota bacterium]